MGTPAYDKQNTRRINLKLNNKTDAEIIRHLENHGNIQGYIKRLILQDMKPKVSIPQPEQDLDKIEQHFDATLALMQSIAKK
jgi:hypothetical protein